MAMNVKITASQDAALSSLVKGTNITFQKKKTLPSFSVQKSKPSVKDRTDTEQREHQDSGSEQINKRRGKRGQHSKKQLPIPMSVSLFNLTDVDRTSRRIIG
jgi:hypothetical protein